MSICKTIIERLGGEIAVSSEVAQEPHSPSGCLLRMSYKIRKRERTATCPAKRRNTAVGSAPGQRGYACPRGNDGKEDGPSGNRQPNGESTILIAEDTDSNFDLLNAILGRKYHLVRAKDGMEAVTMYDEVNPDLILMDIKMPNLDGLEATRIISNCPRKYPSCTKRIRLRTRPECSRRSRMQ